MPLRRRAGLSRGCPRPRLLAGLLVLCAVAPASAVRCSLQLGTLDLGPYDTLAALDTLGRGLVGVSCVKTLGDVLGADLGVDYSLVLGGGASALTPRTMNGPAGSLLNYFVHTLPPGGSGQVWGSGVGGTEVMQGRVLLPALPSLAGAAPVAQILPYQVRVPAGQLVRAGSYAATLTVTLSF